MPGSVAPRSSTHTSASEFAEMVTEAVVASPADVEDSPSVRFVNAIDTYDLLLFRLILGKPPIKGRSLNDHLSQQIIGTFSVLSCVLPLHMLSPFSA